MTESQNRPAKTFGPVWTGAGYLEVSVWANTSENRVKHSATFRRRYNANGTWKETQTLFDGDLLSLARLLEQAWEWIIAQQPKREQRSQTDRAEPDR